MIKNDACHALPIAYPLGMRFWRWPFKDDVGVSAFSGVSSPQGREFDQSVFQRYMYGFHVLEWGIISLETNARTNLPQQ